MEGNDLAIRAVYGNPYPLSVCFGTDEAPELVSFSLQPLHDHRRSTVFCLDIEIFTTAAVLTS